MANIEDPATQGHERYNSAGRAAITDRFTALANLMDDACIEFGVPDLDTTEHPPAPATTTSSPPSLRSQVFGSPLRF